MPKSEEQLQKEVSATIKLVLLEMEDLAALPPAEACSPDQFNDRRHRVVRKIWQLYKAAVALGGQHEFSQNHCE